MTVNCMAEGRLTPTGFVSHCIIRVAQEVQRCREVLPEESLASVEQATEKALMEGRIPWLVEDGELRLIVVRRVLHSICRSRSVGGC